MRIGWLTPISSPDSAANAHHGGILRGVLLVRTLSAAEVSALMRAA